MADIPRQGDLEVRVTDKATQLSSQVINHGDYDEQTVHDQSVVHAIEDDDDRVVYRGKYFIEFLRNSGSRQMNVDGSVTPVDFTVGPGTGKKWYIAEALIAIEDSSINFTKFGGRSALTNGILIKVTENGVERDIVGEPIKRNAGFSFIAYDSKISAASTDLMTVRWKISDSGTFIRLLKSTSDIIKITVQDNLTSISEFSASLVGYEVDE